MAVNGWYPDPDGTPDRYRYWDGTGWSSETTRDPRTPAPGTAAPASGHRKINRSGPLLIGGLVLLVIMVVVGVMVVRSHRSSLVTDPNPPESTVSGWDDSSPLPTPSPSPHPTSESQAPQSRVACTAGDPYAAQPHPSDGRIHGGSLSIAQPGGAWRRDDDYAREMTWAYDVAGADEWVEPRWLAMVAVGSVHTADGFHTPKQAADGIMQCIASSVYYQYFTGRTDVFSKSFNLDGRTGWAIRSEVRVDDPEVKAAGDVVEIIVLDTGTRGQLSYFAGFVPIGDRNRLKILDGTVAGMRLA